MDDGKAHGTSRPARTTAGFQDTHWTTIVELAGAADAAAAGAALEWLCRSYWPPVYAVLRRSGHSPADAEDLCQGFFVHLLQNQRLARPNRDHGRFRSWLLACLKNYQRNEHSRRTTASRLPPGGFVDLKSLDGHEALFSRLSGSVDPDHTFDSAFAHRLVAMVRQSLRTEYVAKGKEPLYAALEPHLTTVLSGEATARISAAMEMNEGAVRVAHSRLKSRFGELMRQHVRQLVLDPADVDGEIRHLLKAWMSR